MSRQIIYPPICLAGSVANPPTTGLLVPDPKLKNPFREDMWVDEIQFLFQSPVQAIVGSYPMLSGAGSFLTKISLGRLPLTGGANVPIWLLGKTLSQVQDNMAASDAGNADPTFVWRLTKPLFVPSGEQLTITIYSLAGTASGITVFAEVFGRSIPAGTPKPKYIDVPFACAFTGTKNVGGGANFVDQSYERDLMNPFDVDMFVERFNGRVAVSTPSSNIFEVDSSAASASIGGIAGDQAGATNTLVRAVSSIGGMMVRDETPFDHLFHVPERSWKVNTWVPPKAFFKFYLREAYSGLSANNSYRPQIAMVGYRTVELQDVFR